MFLASGQFFIDALGLTTITAGGSFSIISNSGGINLIGTTFIQGAVTVAGNFTISGTKTMTATGTSATFKNLYYVTTFAQTSDQRLKKNISDICGGSLQLIEQLKPVNYQWNDVYNQAFNTGQDASGNDVHCDDNEIYSGFIAQDLENVIPNAVGSMDVNNENYKTIKPLVLIPYLVKAIQELSAQVKTLQVQVNAIPTI